MKILIFISMLLVPASLACSENPINFFYLDSFDTVMSENGTLRAIGTIVNKSFEPRGVKLSIMLLNIDGDLILKKEIWFDRNIEQNTNGAFDVPFGTLSVEIIDTRQW